MSIQFKINTKPRQYKYNKPLPPPLDYNEPINICRHHVSTYYNYSNGNNEFRCLKCGELEKDLTWHIPDCESRLCDDKDIANCKHKFGRHIDDTDRTDDKYCLKCGFAPTVDMIFADDDFVEYRKKYENDTYKADLYRKRKNTLPLAGLRPKQDNLHRDFKWELIELVQGLDTWRKIKLKLDKIGYVKYLNDIPDLFGHPIHTEDWMRWTIDAMMLAQPKLKSNYILARLKWQRGDEDWMWVPVPWTKEYLKKYFELFKQAVIDVELTDCVDVTDKFVPGKLSY